MFKFINKIVAEIGQWHEIKRNRAINETRLALKNGKLSIVLKKYPASFILAVVQGKA